MAGAEIFRSKKVFSTECFVYSVANHLVPVYSRFNLNQDFFLQVSDIDHKKALHMLSRPDDVFPKDWKTELSRFVLMRRKAEIEVLSQASNFFSNMSLPVSLNLRQGNHTLPANNGSGSFTAEDLWNTARSGPALIPYLLIKISEALGGTDAL